MHFGDSIFIFLLALVLFGPKKLPEIGRTIGKLLAEFRRASNEFKFQIQEELRNMEEDERRKKLADMQAQKAAESPAGALAAETQATMPSPSTPAAPSILPPSTGTPVSTSAPYATPGESEATPVSQELSPEPAQGSATITPSAAEVAVDPPTPTVAAPVSGLAAEPSAHVDLTANTNGAHPASEAEAPEPGSVSEAVRHG